ncbi:MAG: glycosyltransferase family 39 protein [Lentisphaeria bacterium]|nr:glycosyltransferase family 39 protein [Lentisphaeria bacterium]
MNRKKSEKKSRSSDAGTPAEESVLPIRELIWRESLIFVCTFIFFTVFARMGIDPHHDGVMLIPALRVAEGGVVFRDVFCQYGLLVPLLQGAAVALFGGELLVIRMLTVLFYSGSAVLLDLLWRRYLPSKISWLTAVLFCLLAPCMIVTFHSWNSVYALFFMLLSGFFLLRYLESDGKRYRELCFAGAAAGLTLGCRTPCGIVTVFAAVLILLGVNWFTGKEWRKIMKEAGTYGIGIFSVLLLAAGYISLTGAWEDFFKQNFGYVNDFVTQRGAGGSWKYFCDSIFPFYQEEYYYFNTFFALMPLGAMTMLYFACRKGILSGHEVMKEQLPFIALLILGLGSWHQYYPVPCVRHLFWGGAPLFGAYLVMLCRLWQNKSYWKKAFVIVLTVVLLCAVAVRVTGGVMRLKSAGTREERNVAGIRNIKLNRMECGVIDMLLLTCQLPENLRQRGLLNWSEDSLYSATVPQSGFCDLQFYRFETAQYPGYDLKILQYVADEHPLLLTDHEAVPPGYVIAAESFFMDKAFRLLLPVR